MERLRKAGPNERRCIVRQALGHYRTLVVGAVYTLERSAQGHSLETMLIKALKHCIAVHPILSACIIGEETETPEFAKPTSLDLNKHIDVLDTVQSPDIFDEKGLVKLTLSQANDHIFAGRDQTPPWKIIVLPLPAETQSNTTRYLILFGYYHSHGDGKSGLAFHKTFLSGLKQAQRSDCIYDASSGFVPPSKPLLPTLEMAGRLSISWGFLLSPLLGAYLPSFIANSFGIRASATPEAADQWAGRETFFDPEDYRTCLEVISIANEDVQNILQDCRRHEVKFTGLLHQIIIQALSQVLPLEKAGCFVSQTAVDLRPLLDGITDMDMALCPTAYYELFQRTVATNTMHLLKDDDFWNAARSTTENLAKCAGTLNDQPVGLLSYLRNMYPWTRGQIGSFAPEDGWNIESMIFSQPANISSGCLNFNVVSRHQGDLTIVVSWQAGALDLEDEQAFAQTLSAIMTKSLESFGQQ